MKDALAIAGFIPDIELPSAPDGAPARLLEAPGRTTVFFTLHGPRCPGCRQYLDSLAPSAPEFIAWDARLLAIVPGSAAGVRAPFGKVLADEQGVIADPANASLFVADRYGQIFESVRANATHQLPPPRELEEWLKFLGTLCPE